VPEILAEKFGQICERQYLEQNRGGSFAVSGYALSKRRLKFFAEIRFT
jgi:hypothetical protein